MRAAVYSVEVADDSWKLRSPAVWARDEVAGDGEVGVACADFDFDVADEIAVA